MIDLTQMSIHMPLGCVLVFPFSHKMKLVSFVSKQTPQKIIIIIILKKFYCHEVNPSFKGAFTLNVKSVLSENLGGILGATQY